MLSRRLKTITIATCALFLVVAFFATLSCKDEVPIYSVTYDGNGNTGGTVPVDLGTYTAGSSVIVKDNTGNLTRDGFRFHGWECRMDSIAIMHVTSFTIESNATLYAIWVAI